MAKSKRTIFRLECTVCKNQNYTSNMNAENIVIKNKGQREKVTLNKFCKFCRKTQPHKEVKL